MSSRRGFREFRTGSGRRRDENLLTRISNSLKSNKYFPVDYDHLLAQTVEEKLSANASELKIRHLEQAIKQNKESHILKQHRLAWCRVLQQLKRQRRKLEEEINIEFEEKSADGTLCAHMFKELDDLEVYLMSDLNNFKTSTVNPVWNLRDDLKFWLIENGVETKCRGPDWVKKRNEIQAITESVQQQQREVMEKLYNQERCLEQELRNVVAKVMPRHEICADVPKGIPEEATCLECPDSQLKNRVLDEFYVIDVKYLDRLQMLENQYSDILSYGNHSNWKEKENAAFQLILDQYPTGMPKRQFLLLDRLQQHFPHRSKEDLLSHQEWWTAHHFYQERRKAAVRSWTKDRAELMHKARIAFSEACLAFEMEEVKAEYLQKQKELCEALYEKVKYWREQKMEAMMLEMKIQERQQKEMKEKMILEMEINKRKRLEEKKKICKYQEEMRKEEKKQEEQQQKRLEELQQMLAEQAEYDCKRIKYREEQIQKKLSQRRKRDEDLEEMERVKERRLEALREQVRIIAESNPLRLGQETEVSAQLVLLPKQFRVAKDAAFDFYYRTTVSINLDAASHEPSGASWHAKVSKEKEKYVSIQKPLFELHTLTNNQVIADPRIRLEQRLREIGLHDTDYARHALSSMRPPHLPRKDMESHLFK